jgi:hypothetical protein
MKRRDFFAVAGAAVVTGLNLASCTNDSTAETTATTTTAAQPSELDSHTGVVTLYYEFRIAGPENTNMLAAVDALSTSLAGKAGFLSLSLKNTVGDSTMVKNYPAPLKGVLGTAYTDGFKAGRMPLFYALFIRFENLNKLKAAGVDSWFDTTVAPMLYIYQVQAGTPVKTTMAFDYYEGYFKTVAAGNRTSIYSTEAEITAFLKAQEDTPDKGYITVENHVAIHTAKTEEFNQKVKVLLTTAQQTYRPDVADADFDGALDTTLIGQAGSATNTYYRRAVTTEILQNLQAEKNALRSYLMHGVWQSVFDHENSHLDVRFIQSSTPTGTYVVAGPVEPFYETRRLVNAV